MLGHGRSRVKVYLSGPISLGETLSADQVAKNIQAFHDAAAELRAAGYEVLSPVEGGRAEASWADYLRYDLAMVLAVEAIVVLPLWEKSRGACLECHVGRELGMPIIPVSEALAKAAA